MKKCNDCNALMIDGSLFGKPRFIDMDHDINKFYVDIKTGNETSFLGFKTDEINRVDLNVRVCPRCGKVELYVNPEDINK